MSASWPHDSWSELAVRDNDGLAVSLRWVAVVDAHLDEQFDFHVPGAEAPAAFYHPFAYAA